VGPGGGGIVKRPTHSVKFKIADFQKVSENAKFGDLRLQLNVYASALWGS